MTYILTKSCQILISCFQYFAERQTFIHTHMNRQMPLQTIPISLIIDDTQVCFILLHKSHLQTLLTPTAQYLFSKWCSSLLIPPVLFFLASCSSDSSCSTSAAFKSCTGPQYVLHIYFLFLSLHELCCLTFIVHVLLQFVLT